MLIQPSLKHAAGVENTTLWNSLEVHAVPSITTRWRPYPIYDQTSQEMDKNFKDKSREFPTSSLCVPAKSLQSCPTLCDPMDCSLPSRLLCPWDSPSKNTGVGCCAFLQGNLSDPGTEPQLFSLLHWQVDSLPLASPGKPTSSLLLLLLSRFSHVWLCATPETAAHQAPPSPDSPGKNTGVGCLFLLQCMKVKSESEVAQSCPTLSDPMDRSPPGSSVHGTFQARVLEWGAIAFSTPLP